MDFKWKDQRSEGKQWLNAAIFMAINYDWNFRMKLKGEKKGVDVRDI